MIGELFKSPEIRRLLLDILLVDRMQILVPRRGGLNKLPIALSISLTDHAEISAGALIDKIRTARRDGTARTLSGNIKNDCTLYTFANYFYIDFLYNKTAALTVAFSGSEGQLTERELSLLHFVVVGQLRTEALENLVDRTNTATLYKSVHIEEFLKNICELSIALFNVRHIIKLDDVRIGGFRILSSPFWLGSPFARYIKVQSNVDSVRRLLEDKQFGRAAIDRHGVLRNEPDDDGGDLSSETCRIAYTTLSTSNGNSAIFYIWDRPIRLLPGERRSLEFFIHQHLFFENLTRILTEEAQRAFEAGRKDENLKLVDVYQSARHLVRDTSHEIAALSQQLEREIANSFRDKSSVPAAIKEGVQRVKLLSTNAGLVIDTLGDIGGISDAVTAMKIGEVISSVESFVRSRLTKTGTRTVRLQGKNILINCYPGYLLQVFLNLVSNSLDFFEIRRVSNPSITINIEEVHDKYITMSYSDTAGGFRRKDGPEAILMSRVEITRCFGRGVSYREGESGSGFGLWLVLRHLLIHRGRMLDIENTLQGVKLTFRLGRTPLSIAESKTLSDNVFWEGLAG